MWILCARASEHVLQLALSCCCQQQQRLHHAVDTLVLKLQRAVYESATATACTTYVHAQSASVSLMSCLLCNDVFVSIYVYVPYMNLYLEECTP
jgi:hypothetical protein